MYGKIVQIMECEGIRAVYLDGSGELYSTPVIAWGVTDKGNVVALVVSLTGGYLEDARMIENDEFIGLLPSDCNEFEKPLDKSDKMMADITFPELVTRLKNTKKGASE